jgi:hypothetical protein
VSFISDCIKLATYSAYSHTALLFCDDMAVEACGKLHEIKAGNVIESWPPNGVQLAKSLSSNHTPGTVVDLFSFKKELSPGQEYWVAQFLLMLLGRKYDYVNDLRFVPIVRMLIRKPTSNIWDRKHVFCSELIMEGCIHGGIHLLERVKPVEVPPRDPPRSPLLKLERSVITVKAETI